MEMGITLWEQRICQSRIRDGEKVEEEEAVLRGIWPRREGLTGGRIAQSGCPECREIGF